MSASDYRRLAAEEGKDVTPVVHDNKVIRIEQTENGPKEVEYPIVDLSQTKATGELKPLKSEPAIEAPVSVKPSK